MKKAKESPAAEPATGPLKIRIDGKEREFDIDNPELPDWVEDNKLTSGGYPYDKKMKSDEYDETLERLQIELVKLQAWLQATGKRVLILFEGRDAAGKGGTISVLRQYLNPRTARNVALTKPTETERANGIISAMSRISRPRANSSPSTAPGTTAAGVEPVMGFCTPEQHEQFLDETPHFERMIVNDGIHFFKFWLEHRPGNAARSGSTTAATAR